MKVNILGCGSSTGVPLISLKNPFGEEWGVCDPQNPKNRRSRASVMIEVDGQVILIDTSPDLKEQFIRTRPHRLDAVLYTHAHADHCHGIDELRNIASFNGFENPIPVYGNQETIKDLQRSFPYLFTTGKIGFYSVLSPRIIEGNFQLGNTLVQSFAQNHKVTETLGFRIGDFAYSTDVLSLDEAAFAVLEGVQVWVVDALRLTPAPTHAHLDLTLEWIDRVKPRRAILTHMSHQMDYDSLTRFLPSGVEPAYDGMVIEIR